MNLSDDENNNSEYSSDGYGEEVIYSSSKATANPTFPAATVTDCRSSNKELDSFLNTKTSTKKDDAKQVNLLTLFENISPIKSSLKVIKDGTENKKDLNQIIENTEVEEKDDIGSQDTEEEHVDSKKSTEKDNEPTEQDKNDQTQLKNDSDPEKQKLTVKSKRRKISDDSEYEQSENDDDDEDFYVESQSSQGKSKINITKDKRKALKANGK